VIGYIIIALILIGGIVYFFSKMKKPLPKTSDKEIIEIGSKPGKQ